MHSFLGLFLALLLLSCQPFAQRRASATRPLVQAPTSELLVSGYRSGAAHRFDARTGEERGELSGLAGAQSIHLGPDGLLYAVAEETNRVLRFRGTRFVDVFIEDDPSTPQDENGPLQGPTAAVFGPDGNVYVASFGNDRVLRYDGTTGAYLGTFVPARSGNLDGPDAGMCFGPDGDLYVPSFENHRVLRYDGATGEFLGAFVRAGAGGLRNPRMLSFRPDGGLWLSSWGSNEVLAFAPDGTFLRRLVTMTRPSGFAVNPQNGHLYVTSDQSDRVNRYDTITGERIEIFLGSGAGGVDGATYLFFLERP